MQDWRPLVESSRVRFIKDSGGYLCSLVIMDPLWRDSGIYSCVAINDAGQATVSCTVTVEADEPECDAVLAIRRKQKAKKEKARVVRSLITSNGVDHKIDEIREEDEEGSVERSQE